MSDREISRLTRDLQTGNAEDASSVIRHEIQVNPQSALQEVRQANQLAGPNARLHVGHKQDGDMAIVDHTGRPIVQLGHLGQQNLNNQNGRYQDQSYLNGQNGRPQDTSYLNNQNGRYQDQSYLNGQNGRYQDQSYLNNQNGRPQDMSYLNNQNGRYQDQSYLNGQNGRYQDQSYLNNQNGRYQDGSYSNGGQSQVVGRLANDLSRGDARDASNVLNYVLRSGDDATRVIQEANRCADQQAARMGYRSAMEHIGINRRGDIAIVDQYGQPIERAGNINDSRQQNNNSSYYQDRQQSNYYDNRSTYAPQQNGSNYYGDQYQQQQQQQWQQQQRYGNMNGGNAALGIGIGVVSGLLLSNIGRNNNNNNFHRHR